MVYIWASKPHQRTSIPISQFPISQSQRNTIHQNNKFMMVLFNFFASFLLLFTVIEGKPILNQREEARAKYAEHLFKRQAGPDFFSTHASSPNLVWYDCYTGLKCARYA